MTEHDSGTIGCHPGAHCFSHDLDEPGPGYLRCYECKHLWRSRRSLRRAWRRGYWQATRPSDLVGPAPVLSGEKWGEPLWRRLFVVIFLRERDCEFCPECLHDF